MHVMHEKMPNTWPEYSPVKNRLRGLSRRRNAVSKKLILLPLLATLIFVGLVHVVAAAQVTESRGNESYGWHQVYTGNTSRLTGSANRKFYDYGYKKIQIYGRVEDYWAPDCGWWYVSDTQGINITIRDGKDEIVNYSTSYLSTTKGRRELTYEWGSDDDPGRWNVTVTDNTTARNNASFFIYVRGQLNVTTITINPPNPNTTTQVVNITAVLKDNAGNDINESYKDNTGNDTTPNVTAYITGAGENLVVNMSDDDGDGTWNSSNFQLNATGDHLIIVKASDGHRYWVDGRNSTWVSVGGTFPYASPSLPLILRTVGRATNKAGLSTPLTILAVILIAIVGVAAIRRRRRG